MHTPDDANYHRDRALAELDRGLTAHSPQAARAHMELSGLHMQRAQQLGAQLPRPAFTM